MGTVHVLTTPPMAEPVTDGTAKYIRRRLCGTIEAFPRQIVREMIAEGVCPGSITLETLLQREQNPEYTEEVGQKIIAYIEEVYNADRTSATMIKRIAHRLTS